MTHTERRGSTLVTQTPRQVVLPSQELQRLVSTLRAPLVLAHVNPDADCLGSALALALVCRGRGIEARVGLPGECVPKRLRFMLDMGAGVPVVTTQEAPVFEAVIVDTASEKRINFEPRPDRSAAGLLINIDHHITNTDFGTHNWVDPHASSTSEMIALLVAHLGWELPPAAASLLYAGLHGDTAGFSLPNTSAEALQTAADLVRAGADVAHIGEQLCRSQARQDFELLRRVYDHTTVACDGRIAYSYLSHQDIVEANCSADDIDDQVSIPRALRGVEIAALFSEGVPGMVRVNLRGEGRTGVLEIAQAFGGGGHTQSAGVRVRGKPLRDVIDAVLSVAERHLTPL